MACRLFGTKPLSEPILVYVYLTRRKKISENVIEIPTFSFNKMRLKMSPAKRSPFCLGDNGLSRLSRNRPISQIPECICSISHNAPFRTEMCTFLFWMEHCGIWSRCILGFVNWVNSPDLMRHDTASCNQNLIIASNFLCNSGVIIALNVHLVFTCVHHLFPHLARYLRRTPK